MRVGGVYKIECSNGAFYIGSTVDFKKRWNEHRKLLAKGEHVNSRLQHCWNKYGESAFTFTELEVISDTNRLLEVENLYLDEYYEDENCVNILRSATMPMLGQRNWIALLHEQGKPTPDSFSQTVRAATRKMLDERMAAGLPHWNTGRTRPDMVKRMTGSVQSEESKEKLRQAALEQWKGIKDGTRTKPERKHRKVSAETQEKWRQAGLTNAKNRFWEKRSNWKGYKND